MNFIPPTLENKMCFNESFVVLNCRKQLRALMILKSQSFEIFDYLCDRTGNS